MSTFNSSVNLKSPTLHITIFFTLLVFSSIIFMSIIFSVEVVATGRGKIIPAARVQVIQPEFSGQIVAINVRNGDKVNKGDTLLKLNSVDAKSELKQISTEIDHLHIETIRIESLLSALTLDHESSTFNIDKALSSFSPFQALVNNPFTVEQKMLLIAEAHDFISSINLIDRQIETNGKSMKVTLASIERVETALSARSEQMSAMTQLLERGATSRISFLEVRENFTNLENDREILLRELEQKAAQTSFLKAEKIKIFSNKNNNLVSTRNQINAQIALLRAKERSALRRVSSSTLTAPVSGTVDQLSVFTVGGIARAGDELMRIVPSDSELEVEAYFANVDIGFLEIGQKSNIKLDAFPSERFGFLKGNLIDMSADSIESEAGNFSYITRIKVAEHQENNNDIIHSLRPGMTLSVDIITDKRRIISYFFAPIIETIQKSLGER